jgi:hypothetical protein
VPPLSKILWGCRCRDVKRQSHYYFLTLSWYTTLLTETCNIILVHLPNQSNTSSLNTCHWSRPLSHCLLISLCFKSKQKWNSCYADCQSVFLGDEFTLELVTRCYISLSNNYFFIFSCRAPSLTRGRGCNLQYNDASSISSYIATDGLSVNYPWCRAASEAHDQVLIFLFDNYFLPSRCRAPSPISPMIQLEVKVKSQSHVSVGRNF